MFKKDTVITARQKKTELIIFLSCFFVAYTLNVIAIITYKTPAIELITEILNVLLLALVMYALTVIVRLLIKSVKLIINTIKNK